MDDHARPEVVLELDGEVSGVIDQRVDVLVQGASHAHLREIVVLECCVVCLSISRVLVVFCR